MKLIFLDNRTRNLNTFAKKEEIKESESECVYMDVDDDES